MAGYRYLVDANTLSDFIRNPKGSVTKRLAVVGVATVCTSIIVACELRYGVAKKGSSRLAERVDQALEGLEVLPLDGGADRHYAGIRAHLSRKGQPIGSNFAAAPATRLGTPNKLAERCRFPTSSFDAPMRRQKRPAQTRR